MNQGKFSVKNFERLQHYRDRTPPWIKLYNDLLDDYEFGLLPDTAKAHLLAIWLLASRYENQIPYDETWVGRKINATVPVNLKLLVESGFIVPNQDCSKTLSEPYLFASPEREGEGEREREKTLVPIKKINNYSEEFETFWKIYPSRGGYENSKAGAFKKFNIAIKNGVTTEILILAAKNYAEFNRREGTEPQFIKMTETWLNKKSWEQYKTAPPPAIIPHSPV